MEYKMRMILLTLTLFFGLVNESFSETTSRYLSVVGEGSVPATPDLAVILLGVTHQAKTAGEAMEKVNKDAVALLKDLAESGIGARDIQTDQLIVSPLWTNDAEIRRIMGYEASNMLSVRVRDIPKLGAVLDSALSAGSNDFSGLRFSVQNLAPYKEKARAAAVKDAISRAAGLADAAGVTLGPIITLIEQTDYSKPNIMSAARNTDLAVATGVIDITASVSMTFDLIP